MKVLIVGNGASASKYDFIKLKEDYFIIGMNGCDRFFPIVPDVHCVSDMDYFWNKGNIEIEYEQETTGKPLHKVKATVGFDQLTDGSLWVLQSAMKKDIPEELHKHCHFVHIAEGLATDVNGKEWKMNELMLMGYDLSKLPSRWPWPFEEPAEEFPWWSSYKKSMNFFNTTGNLAIPFVHYLPAEEVRLIGFDCDNSHAYDEEEGEKGKPRNYLSKHTLFSLLTLFNNAREDKYEIIIDGYEPRK